MHSIERSRLIAWLDRFARCKFLPFSSLLWFIKVDFGDDLVGMVSIGDLVRSIISEQKEMISQLEQYILHYTSIT
jgi:hypothetical protein